MRWSEAIQRYRAVLLCCAVCAFVRVSLAQTSILAALTAHGRSLPGETLRNAPSVPPATLEDALHAAYLDAAIIFTGEITTISNEGDAVLVQWHVEQGLQGVHGGDTYTQREWTGLWSGDGKRYSVGERALVLLHAPSVAGFSTPVHDGIIPLHGSAGSSTVDLRWVAQHVVVSDAPRLAPMLALHAANGSFKAAATLLEFAGRPLGQAGVQDLAAPQAKVASDTQATKLQTTTDPNARVDSSVVLGMMHAWQRVSGAAQ